MFQSHVRNKRCQWCVYRQPSVPSEPVSDPVRPPRPAKGGRRLPSLLSVNVICYKTKHGLTLDENHAGSSQQRRRVHQEKLQTLKRDLAALEEKATEDAPEVNVNVNRQGFYFDLFF